MVQRRSSEEGDDLNPQPLSDFGEGSENQVLLARMLCRGRASGQVVDWVLAFAVLVDLEVQVDAG
jgi:hypothetical protein